MSLGLCPILGLLFLSAPAVAEPRPTATGGAEAFASLSDRFMKESLALSPVSASAAGYHEHLDARTGQKRALDAELDDLSPAGVEAQRRFYQEWRQRFAKEAPLGSLDVQDAADWRLIDDQIARGLLDLDRIQAWKHQP